MKIQLYSALWLNIFFIWVVTTQRLGKSLRKKIIVFCKIAFAIILFTVLYGSLSEGLSDLPSLNRYVLFMVPSIAVLLFFGGTSKMDILVMPTVLLNIYLLLQNAYHREFFSFMSYTAINLALTVGATQKKGAEILKSILTNVSFYTLAWMLLHVLGHNDGTVFLSLALFVVVLLQCAGISPFYSHRDGLYLEVDSKSVFKTDLLFVLFVMPIHLIMLRPIFLLLDERLQGLFLIALVLLLSGSLWREYARGRDDLTPVVNIKIFIISVFFLVFLAEDYEFFPEFYYAAVPFVLIHMPLHFKKGEDFNTKDRILNYMFFFLVLGIGPSAVFKVKLYALLILFNQNPYLCFFFVLVVTLVIMKFLIFFIRNNKCLIYIKNPLYFAVFSAIICVYLFSGHIPDKM